MTNDLIVAASSIIVAVGGWIMFWVRRSDNRKDPIPRTAAELAMAKEALGIIQSSRDALNSDVERLKLDRETDRHRIESLENRRETDRARIESLEDRQGKLESLLMRATSFIEVMLRWAHAGTPPPPPVLPIDLYDLVDPSLHPSLPPKDDGQE